MPDLVVSEFLTVDGVMEAPENWMNDYVGEEHLEYKYQEALDAGSHLLGRVTYETFAASWPQRSGPLADRLNSIRKYVVTSRPEEVQWANSTALQGDVVEAVSRLKNGHDDGPIVVAGSRQLTRTLLANNLVDELRLMIAPLLRGSGARLFPRNVDLRKLTLVESRAMGSGVIVAIYRLAGAA